MPALITLPPAQQHRLAPLAGLAAGELLIHEVYKSIQGESRYAGLPCVFVRLTTCHLRCTWCDTPHAFNQGTKISTQDVLKQALAFDCPVVEITGGEPLLQPEVFPLMKALADAGRTVLLETSGANDIAEVDPRVHIIMDLKCPDSGEVEANLWANLNHLKPTDEIKFVIASCKDWEWAEQQMREHRLCERFGVLVSGVFGKIQPAELVQWHLDSGLNARFQLQLHKFVWDPKARGV